MGFKKTNDGRSQSLEALEEIRKGAVKRIQQGESPGDVSNGIGLNRCTIYRWHESYHYGDDDASAAKPIPSAPAKLDAKKLEKLSRIVRDKDPLQMKFELYGHWRSSVAQSKSVRRESL